MRKLLVACVVVASLPIHASALTNDEALLQILDLAKQFTSLQLQLQQLQATSPAAPVGTPVVDPRPTVSSPACPALSRTLVRGSTGTDVSALQRFLIAAGTLSAGSATGYFGVLTEAGVQKWQAAQGIVASGDAATTGFGAVGARTRAAIARNCSGSDSGVTAASVTVTQSTEPLTMIVEPTVNAAASCGGSYFLDYGDGTIDRIQLPADSCRSFTQKLPHVYPAEGTYTVKISSGSSSVSLPITVRSSLVCVIPKFSIPTGSPAVQNFKYDLFVMEYPESSSDPVQLTATGLPQGLSLKSDTYFAATSSSVLLRRWSVQGIPQSTGVHLASLTARNACGSANVNVFISVAASTALSCPVYQDPVCQSNQHIEYTYPGNGCKTSPVCVLN